MKTLGLIGGMSWVSTALYYKQLNEGANRRLGGLHSADVLLWSLDFDLIENMQKQNRWFEMGLILADIAKRLQTAGAEGILLATNTMHKVSDKIEQAIEVPFLHIADATGQVITGQNLKRPALMGTRFTMEEDFYKGRLKERFDLDVRVPEREDIDVIHNIIYNELCKNIISEDSRKCFERIAQKLLDNGADCLILGCTEVGLLLNKQSVKAPIFDTTLIHADVALDFALWDESQNCAMKAAKSV